MNAKCLHRPLFFMMSLILAATFAACGGGNSTGGTTSSSSSPSTSPTTTTGCTAGTSTVNGINTIKFCGTAKGTVSVGGHNYTLTEGSCFNTSGQVGVNIGHEVLDPTNSAAGDALKKQYDYLGALAQASKDGTYQNSLFTGYTHGVDFSAVGSLTLTNNLQAGSFTGKAILTQQTVTGTFTCS